MSFSCSIRLGLAALWVIALGGMSSLEAATPSNESGVRLLEAQLPAKACITRTECVQLARAVGRATVAHRAEAEAILPAALLGGSNQEPHRFKAERPCACVSRLLKASLAAAPSHANALFEIAVETYPDCTESFESALNDLSHAAGQDSDESGVDVPLLGGFGVGFGPGFPGAPGFAGSPPSAGHAVPVPVPVTAVVNG